MLYLASIFVGAFLLFQVQPLIAKLILPMFGGGAAIWTACLLFFQGFLLCGYFYSHVLTRLKNIRHQISVHLLLLGVSLCFLPIGLQNIPHFDTSNSPLTSIVILLAGAVGLPYLLLSATGPLAQRWLSYENAEKLPYKLYSLSNAASLLALLSYPFIFEPLLTLTVQTKLWSLGYVVFAVLIGAVCIRLFIKNIDTHQALKSVSAIVEKNKRSQVLLWLLLSAVGVVLLVATTNAMTQNIPPVPFLWILPLCLYLLSFIICFHSARWYVRWYWFFFFVVSAFAAIMMFFIGSYFDAVSQVVVYCVILFSSCMICHGELEKLKPEVERLTLFYLMMSLGGFLGSAFVAFVAQKIFTSFLEFPVAVLCLFLLFSSCIFWHKYSTNGLADKFSMLMAKASVVIFICLFGFFAYLNTLFNEGNVVASRNFYGVLNVKDIKVDGRWERRLIDGTTSHGTQSQEAGFEHRPMSYYRDNTGVALALTHGNAQTYKVGLIGLGAGTLAAYGQVGDHYHFYELNPAVEALANSHFTYLKNSLAKVTVSLGDARLSLTRELEARGSNQYQVLVVDAFSGDSIPTHLLTKEAFALYLKHLTDTGILVFHVTNTHLNLASLVRALAKASGKQALYFETQALGREVNNAEWVIVTNNQNFIHSPKVKSLVTIWPYEEKVLPVWTDNYSNLLSVLK